MNYFYEAVDNSGQLFLGKLEGVDEAEIQQKLLHLGYHARSIAPAQAVQSAPADLQVTQAMRTSPPQVGHAPAAPSVGSSNLATGYAQPTTTGYAQPSTSTQTIMAGKSQTIAVEPLQTPPASVLLPLSAPPVQTQTRVAITLAGNAARVRAVPTPGVAYNPTSTATAESDLAGVSTHDLLLFFQQLASLVRSGMSIYSALDNLAPRTPNRNLAQTAREMAEQARTGGAISDVMGRYPRIYPEHIVGLVRAGELGGFLDIALGEIADNFDRNIALYRGSWIPKTMAVQALFTLALGQPIFPYLFPNGDYRGLILAEVRNLILAAMVLAGAKAGSIWINLPKNRRLRDGWALKIPPFGDLQRQTALATFSRVLRRLFNAGVSPSAAWEGAMSTTSNVVLREKLTGAHLLMQQGRSLADAFIATGLFPGQVEQLIVTGTQSGEVVESLDRIEAYYQNHVGEASGKVRYTMLRLGVLAMLILGGAAMCWMAYNYFHGIFNWVDQEFPNT